MFYLVALDLELISLAVSHMNPVYLDLIKMFAGCIGWIGGLTLFMYMREKKKAATVAIAA